VEQLGRQAHVWYLVPGSIRDSSLLQHFRSLLSAEELHRHERLHFAEDRHRFLVSHALIRTALSRYADLPPERWHFSLSPKGKPEIGNPGLPPLRFNLTHTAGLAACVVNLSGECGIDAEKITLRHDPLGVARRMFSDPEYLTQQTLEGRRQLEYFFERWTLREAYVKARGIGIHFPTRKLRFRVSSHESVHVEFAADIDDRDDNWQIQLLRPTEEHIAAVTVARPGQAGKDIVARPFDFSE
jgi:4'-phosphopantetheinyl transferase